ncbi:MAG: sugar transferase [Candidatus Pacebacteria bacterium]|nr:sugar transferase [Candidatus Paceibacterota bacterium]
MKYRIIRRFILLSGDISLIFFSLYIALILRWSKLISPRIFIYFFKQFSWLFLFWIFLFFIFDFYSLNIRFRSFDFYRYFSVFLFLAMFSGILYFYLFPSIAIAPKTILFLNIGIFSILFILWHSFFDWIFKRSVNKEKIIFWGSFSEKKDLINYIKNSKLLYKIEGDFNESTNIDEIHNIIKNKKIKKIIISPEVKNSQKLFFSFPEIEIESFFDFYEETTKKIALSGIKDPNIFNSFIREEKAYTTLKRMLDFFIASIGSLFFISFFPIVAILIKINSKGPIFFIQERVGKDGRIFQSYKFRSMHVKNNSKKIWREKDKREITFVGRFLRFTHIDELPQFLNMLRGDISIIGPRPEWKKLAKQYEKVIPFYSLRHKVKPGLTGWAQINYPPSTSVKEAREKFQYDLYYIKNRSITFDVVIFLKSLRKFFG